MSQVSAQKSEREFRFDDRHFDQLRTLARNETGIELNDTKRELVYGRLARRLRALGLDNFDQYCELLGQKGSPETVNFVNAITTNVTSFFREEHHFDFLQETVIPELMQSRRNTRKIRIWSAACSTGQEPYSIAMTVARSIPSEQTWDCKILATDIDGNVVSKASSGIYPAHEVGDLGSPAERKRWFKPVAGTNEPTVQVADSLRSMIYFRELNLMHRWPLSGPIDVIFCRNVVIYFSKETQRKLFKRFAEVLAPDGYVFIGHSESMLHSTDLFESAGRTIYRRRRS